MAIETQIFTMPAAIIALIIIIFVLWKFFKIVLKKVFAILGVLAGIAIILYALSKGQLDLINLLIAVGIILASLAGFF